MTVPTQIATGLLGGVNWFNSTTPKTASLTVQVGDIITLIGVTENTTTTLSTPTGGTSNTWTLKRSYTTTNHCATYIWQCTVTTAQTFTLSLARSVTTNMYNARYWVHRGAAGQGVASTFAATADPSVSLTTTGPDSVLIGVLADWDASATNPIWASVNGLAGTSPDDVGNGTNYGVHTRVWDGVGVAGSKTVSATFSGAITLAAVEIPGVASAGDTTAPTVPTGVTISGLTTTGFTVSWTASTDAVGVTGYEVYLNGSSYATPTGTSQVVTGRTPNTLYSVQVRARDAAGNWSALTTAVSATTFADTLAETYWTGSAWVNVGNSETYWTGSAWV